MSGIVYFLTVLALGIAVGMAAMFIGAAVLDSREDRADREFGRYTPPRPRRAPAILGLLLALRMRAPDIRLRTRR